MLAVATGILAVALSESGCNDPRVGTQPPSGMQSPGGFATVDPDEGNARS
jgi:hypothetical protein